MEKYRCPSCGGELFDSGQDERLEEFVIWGSCYDCGEEAQIVFKAVADDPWKCPKCGADCDWNMDEEGDFSDDESEYIVYGTCPDCGCEVEERYLFDRIEIE